LNQPLYPTIHMYAGVQENRTTVAAETRCLSLSLSGPGFQRHEQDHGSSRGIPTMTLKK